MPSAPPVIGKSFSRSEKNTIEMARLSITEEDRPVTHDEQADDGGEQADAAVATGIRISASRKPSRAAAMKATA